jgi:uncharacterized membrane protein
LRKIRSSISATIEGISAVRFFIITASVFGFLFLFITPPFQTPDEPVHFFRAYQISEGNLSVDNYHNLAGGFLPKAVGDTVTETSTNPIIKFLPKKKYSVRKTATALSLKVNQKDQVFYDFSSTALNPPVPYAPQVIGIEAAKAIHAPPIVMMYAGRALNLITWISVGALAISLLPRKKWALVLLALMPMALFQAASFSPDVVAIGSVMLFFAYILKLRESDRVLTRKQLLSLLAIAIIMSLSKQTMFLFLPLILLLPKRIFPKKSVAVLAKAVIILAPLLLWAFWFMATRHLNQASAYTNINDPVPAHQFKFILLHPYSYVNVLWNTYFFNWGDTVTGSFIGSFGWVDAPLSESIVIVGYLALALALLANPSETKIATWLSKRQKVLVGTVAAIYWLAISTALYVYYSPVGYKIIVGLQGRYFIPFAILLIPLLYSNWLKTSQQAYRRIVTLAPIFLLVASTITIFIRYYVNNV